MTNAEREMDLNIADLEAENRRLKKVEQAAQAVVKSFSNSIDYNTWDEALDKLEAVLKEKNNG
jgi:Ser-tRNA(Ala) deacylase AlaX